MDEAELRSKQKKKKKRGKEKYKGRNVRRSNLINKIKRKVNIGALFFDILLRLVYSLIIVYNINTYNIHIIRSTEGGEEKKKTEHI